VRYPNRAVVRAGDAVDLDGCVGTVVFCVANDEYAEPYSRADWQHMTKAVGVLTVNAGLIVFDCDDASSGMLARSD
jgi:hypothetical protein